MASALGTELDKEIFQFRSYNFAESTKATYKAHRNTYLRFCFVMGYDTVPASTHTICQYAAFLARSLTYASINNYLAIIGLLHKEFGLVNPLTDNWPLKSLLTGVKRVKGNQVVQKLPITLDILRGIYRIISLRSSFDASFWAVCLVAFYGFFRKSHLLPLSDRSYDPNKQFSRSSFIFFPWGALLEVRWSKTIQFRDRVVHIPLPYIPSSVLCPIASVLRAMAFTKSADAQSHAFCYFDTKHLRPKCLTYRLFLVRLRECLSMLGYSPSSYAGHSFRRGGASFAFESGIPIELIKMLGDWKSDSVLLYLTAPLKGRLYTTNLISKSIIRLTH